MPYSAKMTNLVNHAPRTLGNRLGRWAVHRDFAVAKVATITGATRQTVYNWFAGGEMLPVYAERVNLLIKILEVSPNGEQAWRLACQKFNIRS